MGKATERFLIDPAHSTFAVILNVPPSSTSACEIVNNTSIDPTRNTIWKTKVTKSGVDTGGGGGGGGG